MKYANFRRWEAEVDKLMLNTHGVGIDDIPDMDWNGWYLAEWTPKEAVEVAIDKTNTGLLW